MTQNIEPMINDEQVQQFQRDGYLVVRSFLSPEENANLREHFMKMQSDASQPEHPVRKHYQVQTMEEAQGDVLRVFPRVMMPHRFDKTSLEMMLDARTESVLNALFGEQAIAAQSMFYFKPPGARGQALHQDNFYLKVSPGTCMAAWFSIDDADDQNGTLFVVPGSHTGEIQCPHAADLKTSFTTEEVDIPEGMEQVPVNLKAGDVLFFNGALIHGSYPNATKDRFRRSFICHYVPERMTAMNSGYYPLHSFDGKTFTRDVAEGGGICGTEEWQRFQDGIAAQKVEHSRDMEWLKRSAVGDKTKTTAH